MSPSFSPATTSYSAGVDYNVSSVTVTPTASNTHAGITVNGEPVASGGTSAPISLAVGSNTINVVVTAQDGTTQKTYTISVTRGTEPSHNADLSGLSLSYSKLKPDFSAGTTNYSANVAYDVSIIDVTATAADASASITINGMIISSGIPHTISLNEGSNIISVVVTAQDGTTVKTYTIDVTRAEPSHNADLSGLSSSYGRLSPGFNSNTTSYSMSVPYSISSINVTATAADATASIKINGTVIPSGSPHTIILNVGLNQVSIEVTAQDMTTVKTYTVHINRAEPSHDADLSGLDLSNGHLYPSFDSQIFDYETEVGVSSITVKPTAAGPGAYITVNGTPVASGTWSGAITLNSGKNNIIIKVKAQDGMTENTYTVAVWA